MGTIFTLVIVAVTLVVVLIIFFPALFKGGSQFTECGGYCSYSCDTLTAGYPVPTGDDWCSNGVWNLKSFAESKEKNYYKKKIGEGDATEVDGASVGLRCCNLLPKKEPPEYFLTKDLRKGEIETDDDGRRRDMVTPPRITAYFGDDSLPISMGSLQDVYSGMKFKMRFDLAHADCSQDPCKLEAKINDEPITKTCSVKLIDADGNNLLSEDVKEELKKRTGWDGDGWDICSNFNKDLEVLSLPDIYEGEVLELQILLTKEKGRYNPYETADTKYVVNFKVENPIRLSGLSPAFTQEKTIVAQCQGVECTDYYFKISGLGECNTLATIDEAMRAGNEMNFIGESSDRVSVTLEREFDDAYFCVYAITKTGQVINKLSQVPIHIDRAKPVASANFHAFPDMYTTVSCSDTGGAGCSGAVGYHYINKPVDFVGALFNGFKDPNKCPADRGSYSFVAVDQESGEGIIPFYSAQDFMVLCVMVEDNAGNNNRDIVLTYNSWEVLEAIASDQLANGGIGSGYTNYNFWT